MVEPQDPVPYWNPGYPGHAIWIGQVMNIETKRDINYLKQTFSCPLLTYRKPSQSLLKISSVSSLPKTRLYFLHKRSVYIYVCNIWNNPSIMIFTLIRKRFANSCPWPPHSTGYIYITAMFKLCNSSSFPRLFRSRLVESAWSGSTYWARVWATCALLVVAPWIAIVAGAWYGSRVETMWKWDNIGTWSFL